jgi:hypothetical protein
MNLELKKLAADYYVAKVQMFGSSLIEKIALENIGKLSLDRDWFPVSNASPNPLQRPIFKSS